jgi:hypothetical protein
MIAYHYEEGTVQLKEELAKESAEEMDNKILDQIRKNDRGGPSTVYRCRFFTYAIWIQMNLYPNPGGPAMISLLK